MEGIHSNPPPRIQSFLVSQVHAEIDLNKKRKLLDKQLSLPIRKLKFRDADPGGEHSSQSAGEHEGVKSRETHTMSSKNNDLHVVDTKSSQPESEKGSNNFVEDLDCAMSQYVNVNYGPEFSEAFADEKHAKGFSEMVYACDKPSTSSASCSSSSPKNTLFTLENGSFKSLPIGEEKSGFTENEDDEFEYHAHLIYDHDEGFEESSDTEPRDMMVNSSEMPSDPFILSSGRWEINHGAQAGTRKPTIDQEFEQYFSSLML